MTDVSRFIVLIPHRDAGNNLDDYRKKLFSAGYSGAYSFPAAAPLAKVSGHFTREELKELALNIRKLTDSRDGKIRSSGAGFVRDLDNFPFLGIFLDFSLNESHFSHKTQGKIIKIVSSPALCAAITGSDIIPDGIEIPVLSFRAASLANLAIKPLQSGEKGYSFEWKTNTQVWLPKYHRKSE